MSSRNFQTYLKAQKHLRKNGGVLITLENDIAYYERDGKYEHSAQQKLNQNRRFFIRKRVYDNTHCPLSFFSINYYFFLPKILFAKMQTHTVSTITKVKMQKSSSGSIIINTIANI